MVNGLQKIQSSFQPAAEWGPKDPEIKRAWIDYNKQRVHFSWIPNPKWFKSKQHAK